MSKIFNLAAEYGSVVYLESDVKFGEGLKALVNMVNVFLKVFIVDHHVVEIKEARLLLEFLKTMSSAR